MLEVEDGEVDAGGGQDPHHAGRVELEQHRAGGDAPLGDRLRDPALLHIPCYLSANRSLGGGAARRLRRTDVGHLAAGRGLADTGLVAQRHVGDRVADPLPGVAGTDRQEHARAVTAAHEDVLRVGREVHEVPGLDRPLLTFDQQQALAAQDEEVLLPVLRVVVAVRLPRPQHLDVDAVVLEVRRALKGDTRAELVVVEPRGVARVDDEPSLAGRLLAAVAVLHPGLGHHAVSPSPRSAQLAGV